MKKTFKRFMAFAMVAVMMANPVSALAAELPDTTTSPAIGSADASGDVEGFVDTTIFKVVLPTSAEGTFDFIMDPQGLISATSGEAHSGATFENNATVFFNTASADASGDYKSTSNYIQVLNKGTVDVNVSVEATIANLGDIKMASGNTFASGDAAIPELYLAFTASGDASGDAKDSAVALTKDGAKLSAVLNAASESYYEFNYVSGEYTFDLKDAYASGDADDFSDYSFALTGACNPYADWTDVKGQDPTVKVIWTLEDAEAASPTPSVQTTATFTKGTALSIPVNLGKDDTAATKATVTACNTRTGTFAAMTGLSYDATNNKIIVAGSAWGGASSGDNRYIKVVFNDTAKTTVLIEISVVTP